MGQELERRIETHSRWQGAVAELAGACDVRFADWGELSLHCWLSRRYPGAGLGTGIGDDAAIVRAGQAKLAITTDVVVEGVHFRRGWMTWRQIGARAAYGCLSDLAATCAKPLVLLLSIGIPPSLSAGAVRSFIVGLASAAEEFGAQLAGGDTTASSQFFADVVAVGEVVSEPWLRGGAKPGDVVAVTGMLGAPAAAIALLYAGKPLPHPLRKRLISPVPRIREALLLADATIHAAIDISDGLLLDARRMAEASGVRIVIEADSLPIAEGVRQASRSLSCEALEFVAGGGEEYELLLAMPRRAAAAARRRLQSAGCPLTAIGVVEEGEGVVLLDCDGHALRLARSGWEHYGPPSRSGQ